MSWSISRIDWPSSASPRRHRPSSWLLALEIADRGYVLSHGELVAADAAARLREDSALLATSYLGEQAR